MALTAAQRAKWVAEMRARPGVQVALRTVVGLMTPGHHYTVETFKGTRQRTVSGVLKQVDATTVFLVDDAGRLNRLVIADITRITVPEVSDGR